MRIPFIVLVILSLFLFVGTTHAQVPQTLSYQGYLEDATSTPLNTTATLTFSLWTDPTSTNPADQAWTEIHNSVAVTDGLYSVSLGSLTSFSSQGISFASAYWLEITVDAGSGPVTLAPRTVLEAVPYAFHAMNTGSGGSAWALGGNSGTVPGTHFLGTLDATTLELRVNGERALRIEPTAEFDAPNLIGGHRDNTAPGVNGATISGGGFDDGVSVWTNTITGDYGTVGGGRGNTADLLASLGGGQLNTASGQLSTIAGGHKNTTGGYISTIGGGHNNTVSGDYGTVAGGQSNIISAEFGTIGGGGALDPASGNRVTDEWGTVGGGHNNRAGDDAGTTEDAQYATVGGGFSNAAREFNATVGGGGFNTASGSASVISGGLGNTASDDYATVGGGAQNNANGNTSTIAGGFGNIASEAGSTISGGRNNAVSAAFGTIGGGGSDITTEGNRITDEGGTVAGGRDNQAGDNAGIPTDARFATVGGGFGNTASHEFATVSGGIFNTSSENGSTVSGGHDNTASGGGSTIAGGGANTASGTSSVIGGGTSNLVIADNATISGGGYNIVDARFGTVGGGGSATGQLTNRVTDEWGTVAGGASNTAGNGATTTTDARFATVGGGFSNTASAEYAAISGGDSNVASGFVATVGGGRSNVAINKYATVPGGLQNTAAGETSFAAGRRAQANHNGSFVWGDYTDADVASTGNNQFIARASGGFWLGTTSAVSLPAGRFLNTSTGGYLSSGGTWTNASDFALKKLFQPINPQQILDQLLTLPIQAWTYKAEADGIRHLGPTAQDFAAAFGLGGSDKAIATVDADGVALAAIQGMHALLVEQNIKIKALQQHLDALQAQVTFLLQERQP